MASFFEKLKKGMGIEEPIIEKDLAREKVSKKPKKSPKESQLPTGQVKTKRVLKEKKPEEIKKLETKLPSTEKREEEEDLSSLPSQTKMPEEKKEEQIKEQAGKESLRQPEERKEKNWPSFARQEEGQLAIDVYQTENDLVIQSAIAGVKPENLDISMERDIITIKGSREKPFEENGDYFIQECFWGPFSREVILPSEVDPQRAVAEMKNNILTIRIPKILREKKRRIIVRE